MANLPKYRAYTVTQSGNGKDRKSRWTEIGAAWETQKGNLRITLNALPLNGELVLIPPKVEQPDDSDAA